MSCVYCNQVVLCCKAVLLAVVEFGVMTQVHRSHKTDNPYIETLWMTQNVSDGVYQATPDGSWDLIVLVQADGTRSMMLTGQATKTMQIPYTGGTSSVVISFAPGAYMPGYHMAKLVDSFEMLPNVDDVHFELLGHTFALPHDFDEAEKLVEQMVSLGMLKNDRVVDGVLNGSSLAMSDRAKQRHFASTTGISQKSFEQIKRAQVAVSALQQGKKPSDVAAETGYSDQPHLAKSLKKIMDTKPSSVDDIHKL
jgi:hypothetical protein